MHAIGQVARWLERADPPRSARATPYAAVVRGLAWHLRVGGAWRALPFGLVHWRTAYGWLRRWLALGLFEALLRQVAGLRRRAAGRKPEPRLAIIDTQSVECIPVRGPRGYDAAKKCSGASAWPWWTRTALGSPWPSSPRTCRTGTAWTR